MSDCMFLRREMLPPKKIITVEFTPTAYSISPSGAASTVTNGSNAFNPYTNTSAYATCLVGTVATSYFLFQFNTSSIPSNATILEVSCKLRASKYSETFWGTVYANVAGATGGSVFLKYSNQSISTSSSSYNTFSGVEWTLEEAQNAYAVVLGNISATSTTDHYIYMYGATLTVTYSYY